MKTIAVIGASGMLGFDLVENLKPFFSVSGITKENYKDFLNKEFDVVINANGNSKRFWANKNILEDFTRSTISVYKSLFDFRFKKYIYISSSDVYENHSTNEYTNEARKISPLELSPYGFHKYISEIIIKKNVKNYLILRCSMMLGKNLKKGPIYDILNNKELFISQNSRLQMITTEEISKIIKVLIKKEIKAEIFNLGGKGTVKFKDINKYTNIQISYLQNSEKQIYEMSIRKISKFFSIRSSEYYLQEYLRSVQLLS